MQMADAAVFFYCRLGTEPLPIHKALSGIGIHRKVTDLECGKVLEEVATLRGRHTKVAESGLNDYACPRNLVPGNRDAEPRIIRAPAADSNQQIRDSLFTQLGVVESNLLGHFLTAGTFKSPEIDYYNIVHILNTTVP